MLKSTSDHNFIRKLSFSEARNNSKMKRREKEESLQSAMGKLPLTKPKKGHSDIPTQTRPEISGQKL